jgi:hypothetical protein
MYENAAFLAPFLLVSNHLHILIGRQAREVSSTIDPGEPTAALFFSGMVMAHVLVPTGLFEYRAGIALRLMGGDIAIAMGRRHQRLI